jgi:hypothetical protein
MRLLHDLGAAARSAFRREAAALTLKLFSVFIGFVGMGLLIAAAVLGMARLVGPILAPALIGVALLSVAAVLWLYRRKPARQPSSEAKVAAQTVPGSVTGAEAAFAAGFVLGRLLIRRFAEKRES